MEKLIQVRQDGILLEGQLTIPQQASGLVLFAHGSGSSRLSPRNQFVASVLCRCGIATLLIDLLSVHEDMDYARRFDITLLSERLSLIIHWLSEQEETRKLSLGLFGASTGAAAALEAAAAWREGVKAVVSRGGRPDLAMPVLRRVEAPTLLIVGGEDFDVIELNKLAYAQLNCVKKLEIVPRATHLFEEEGCLEGVAELAQKWFQDYL